MVVFLILLAIPALAVAIWLLLVGPFCLLMYVANQWSADEALEAFRTAPATCWDWACQIVMNPPN